jgi:hypothetical protein
MKNRLRILKIFILIFSTILLLSSTYLFYSKLNHFQFVTLIFTASWFIQIVVLISLDFQNKYSKWLLPLSLILSSFSYININSDLFLTTWKYQLTVFNHILFGYWFSRFCPQTKSYTTSVSFTLLVLSLGYLFYVISSNQKNETYFYVAQWNSTILGFTGIILTLRYYYYSKKVPNA